MRTQDDRAALRIVFWYVLASAVWIIVSDDLVIRLIADHGLLEMVSQTKGLVYIGVMALLLFFLLRGEFQARRQTVEALAQSEATYRALFENSLAGLFIYDAASRILDVNPAGLRMSGFTRAALLQQEMGGLVTLVPKAAAPLEPGPTPADAPPQQEGRLHRQDGRVLPVEVFTQPLPGGRWLSSAQDISERQQRELQLRQLSQAVEQSPASIEITDPAGFIVYVNPKFEAASGYALAELRGQTPRVLKSGETSAETYARLWQTITAGAEWRGEFHNRRKNGDLFWESAVISPIKDSQGQITHFLAVKEDITARKETELTLRRTEAELRATLDSSHAALVLLDPAGRVRMFNRVAADYMRAMTGRALAVDDDLLQWALPGAEISFAANFRTALSGQRIQFEKAIPVSAARPAWFEFVFSPVEVAGQIVGVSFMAAEISERKQVEAALRYQAGLLESISDAVIATDQEFRILTWNGAAERIYGWRAEEVIGQSSALLAHPDLGAEQRADFQRELAAHGAWRGEWRQQRRDGAPVFILSSVTVLYDEAGATAGFVAVNHDISARKQAELALQASEARYRALFENAPVSLWEEDFSAVRQTLTRWQAEGVTDLRAHLAEPERVLELTGLVKIKDINQATLALYGASDKSYFLETLRAFSIDENLAVMGAEFAALAEGQTRYHDEIQTRTFTGDLRATHLEVLIAPGAEATWDTVLVSLLDLTERQKAEAALRESEARLQQAQRLAHIGVWEWNPLTDRTTWSEEMFRIYGIAPEQFTGHGQDYLAFTHPDDRQLQGANIAADFAQASELHKATGLAADVRADPKEFRIRRPDGSVCWVRGDAIEIVDAAGRPAREVGILMDITDQKNHELAIQRQLAMLNALYAEAHQLSETLDPGQVGALVTRLCVETFNARLAWLGEAEPEGAVRWLAQFPPDHDYARRIRVRWDDSPEGQGPAGRAIRERAVAIAQPTRDPRFQPWQPLTGDYGFQINAAFPLLSRDRALGHLSVYSDQPDYFSPERLELFQAFAHQAAAALANARLFESVSEQREQLRGLAARLADIDNVERRALARELHDRVGANLTALNLNLNLVHNQLPAEALAVAGSRLEDSLQLLAETMAETRAVMFELRPAVLDDYGLLAALRWQAAEATRRTGVQVSVVGQEPEPRLSSAAETAFFRVAQEALTNILKHAEARQVEMRLVVEPAQARLFITDDGRGFDPAGAAPAQIGGGWGLLTMRERAHALGGETRVESRPGAGTRIVVELPR